MYIVDIIVNRNNEVCKITMKKIQNIRMAANYFTHPKVISALKNHKGLLNITCWIKNGSK